MMIEFMRRDMIRGLVLFSIILFYANFLLGCRSLTPEINSNNNTDVSSPAQPSANSDSARIRGESFQEDTVGDVRDGNGRRPSQKLPEIDLIKVRVEAVESDLKTTFTADNDFPLNMPSDQSAVWDINACTPDGNHCCIFGAKVIGAKWVTYVFDMGTARNKYAGISVVRGKELIVTVPQDDLPDWLRHPFKWWANSESNGSWSDRVPDKGKDILNAPTVTFPKAQNN